MSIELGLSPASVLYYLQVTQQPWFPFPRLWNEDKSALSTSHGCWELNWKFCVKCKALYQIKTLMLLFFLSRKQDFALPQLQYSFKMYSLMLEKWGRLFLDSYCQLIQTPPLASSGILGKLVFPLSSVFPSSEQGSQSLPDRAVMRVIPGSMHNVLSTVAGS